MARKLKHLAKLRESSFPGVDFTVGLLIFGTCTRCIDRCGSKPRSHWEQQLSYGWLTPSSESNSGLVAQRWSNGTDVPVGCGFDSRLALQASNGLIAQWQSDGINGPVCHGFDPRSAHFRFCADSSVSGTGALATTTVMEEHRTSRPVVPGSTPGPRANFGVVAQCQSTGPKDQKSVVQFHPTPPISPPVCPERGGAAPIFAPGHSSRANETTWNNRERQYAGSSTAERRLTPQGWDRRRDVRLSPCVPCVSSSDGRARMSSLTCPQGADPEGSRGQTTGPRGDGLMTGLTEVRLLLHAPSPCSLYGKAHRALHDLTWSYCLVVPQAIAFRAAEISLRTGFDSLTWGPCTGTPQRLSGGTDALADAGSTPARCAN